MASLNRTPAFGSVASKLFQIFGGRPCSRVSRRRSERQVHRFADGLESRCLLSAASADTSFGQGGRVVTDFTDLDGSDDSLTAIKATTGGKTIAVGNDGNVISWISRYNANGSLDETFGVGGKIATSTLRGANDVHVFSNGNILIAGRAFNGFDNDLAILMLTSDGSVDETFGSRGLAVADYAGFDDEGTSIAIQADGRILVAGFAHDGGDRDFAVARFNTDGTLDTSYSTDGKQTVQFDANFNDEAREIKIDNSGKAVLAGFVFDGGDRDFAIARLTVQGNLDTTFDADGRAVTDFFGNDDEAHSLVISSTGVITAGGSAFSASGDFDFALAQYNNNGTLRGAFDGDGKVTTDLRTNSSDTIFEIELDSSGRIVAAGGTEGAGLLPEEDFAVARYNGNTGALDSSVGDGVAVFTTFFANVGDQAQAMDIDSSGRLIVGGFTRNNAKNFGVVRYSGTTITPDSGFGVGGRVVTDFTSLSGSSDRVTAVKSMSGGKTVVVGNEFGNASFVARYNSNGTLDATFGSKGRVAFNILEGANDVHVFADGSLLVAGRTFRNGQYDLALLKLTPSGDFDATFGTRGLAFADFAGFYDEAFSLAVQSNGQILAAGSAQDGNDLDFAIARFNTDGTLDTTYGVDGKRTISFDANFNDEARELKIDGSGKAVLAGYVFNGGDRDFAVARVTTQGNLDTTFDADGRLVTDFGGNRDDEGFSLVISSTNIITVGGYAKDAGGKKDFALAQYTNNGSLRNAFDADGKVTTDFRTDSDDQIAEIELDSSGRIVAAGGSFVPGSYPQQDFAFARYNGNTGALDTSIGDGGRGFLTFFASLGDEATAMDLDAQGRWVIGGFTFSEFENFAIARFDGTNGTLDTSFGSNGRVVTDFTDFSGTRDTVTAVRSLPNGKTVVLGNDGRGVSWVARYNSDGSLDSTFGIGGRVASGILRSASDVHVFADGSMLVAGQFFNGFDSDLAIGKLTPSGDIDTTFGFGGLATADYGFDDIGTSIAIQPDGKIVVGGSALTAGVQTVTTNSTDVPVAINDLSTVTSTLQVDNPAAITDINVRVSLTHTFDADLDIFLVSPQGTFIELSTDNGGGGANYTNTLFDDSAGTSITAGAAPFNGTFRPESPLSLLNGESANGTWTLRITDDVGGDVGTLSSWSVQITSRQFDFAAARFNADGTLDTDFSGDGLQTVEFTANRNNEVREVKLDSSGKIVLAGYAFDGTDRDFAIARLTAQGNLDTTFDGDGKVVTDFGGNLDDDARSVVISSSNIITLGGTSVSGGQKDFALAQYNANGSLRNAFDTDGRVTTDFRTNSDDELFRIKLDSDGNIVAAGGSLSVEDFPQEDFALARYNASTGAIDSSLGDGGRVYSTFFTYSRDQARAMDIDSQGRWVVGGVTANQFNNFAIARFGESVPEGTAGSDSFVVTYNGTAPSGTVTVTRSSGGGPAVSLGTFSMGVPLTLNGLGGTDSVQIVGGSTSDTFTVNNTGIVVNGASLQLTSIENRTLRGLAGNDVYYFDADTQLGTYTLDESGGGTDAIRFSQTSAAVALHLGVPGLQTVNANLKLILGSAVNFENATGGNGNDSLKGNSRSNTISGNGGNDSIVGFAGSDLMIGGPGNDTYFLGIAGSAEADRITELESQGIDTINFSPVTTSVSVHLASTAVQNVHTNRTLRLNLGTTIENVVGGSGNDTLKGNNQANRLDGGGGNDTLIGFAGNDLMAGGSGNDTYYLGVASGAEADRVTELFNQGIDTLNFAPLSTAVSVNLALTSVQNVNLNRTLKLNSGITVENVIGGSGNDTLKGNNLANALTGNNGNDTLIGYGGSDVMAGGVGNDTYFFGAATSAEADQVTELVGQGTDTLSFAPLTTAVAINLAATNVQNVHANRTLKLNLGNSFENVIGGSGSDTLIGNTLANVLTGNAGHDILVGGNGRDRLNGGSGRDILIGGRSLDVLDGGADDDILIAGTTIHDSSFNNLAKIRTRWISNTTYSARVTALRAGVGSPPVSLKAKVNVLNDAGENDSLTGGTGTDWYFRAIDDVIVGLVSGELIDVL